MLRTYYSRTYHLPIALAAALFLGQEAHAQRGVGINTTGAAPNGAAVLDIDVSGLPANGKKGLLIPRMLQTERTSIPAPATGLLVYQTDEPATGPSYDPQLARGLWYFDGTQWVRLTNDGWYLAGNSGTNPATQRVGTSTGTNDPLYIRTNDTERMYIDGTTGQVGVNTNTPNESLCINGALKLFKPAPLYATTNYSITNNAGVIRFDDSQPAHTGNVTGTAAGWKRLENEEVLVTGEDYADQVLNCPGAAGITSGGNYTGDTPASPAATRRAQTPFPTSQSTYICGSRVQYLILASELSAPPFDLCTGWITSIGFISLDDDPLSPTPVALNLNIKVEATASNSLTGIDNALNAAVNRYSVNNFVVTQGQIDFTLTSPFFWNGASNLIVEVNYLKSSGTGISPRVNLTTGLGFQATAFAYLAATSLNPTPGSSYTTTPLNPNVSGFTYATNNTRPVIRIGGNVKTPTPTPNTGDYVKYTGALVVGDAVWASTNYHGPGTVSAQNEVYDSNGELADYVFDDYFDHKVRPEDAKAAAHYSYVPLDELRDQLEQDRHLPSMPSRSEWDNGGRRSLGSLSNGLWATVETQALYIGELENDLKVLEALASEAPMTSDKAADLKERVEKSPRWSEEQRAWLIDLLQQRSK